MISVVLVDDEVLIRRGLRAVIDAEHDLEVIGEADDGSGVVPLARRLRPDVVLMDVRMPKVDGIRATELLVASMEEPPRILVVTTFENDEYVYDALRAGASGFVLKRVGPEQVVEAIRVVARGESLLFPAAIRTIAQQHAKGRVRIPQWRLTEREEEVLRLMTTGATNGEIAASLYVSVETVKTHVGNVLAKTGARDRTQAVIEAYETGFISPG